MLRGISDTPCVYLCVGSDEAGSSVNVLLEMSHRTRVVQLLIDHVQVCLSVSCDGHSLWGYRRAQNTIRQHHMHVCVRATCTDSSAFLSCFHMFSVNKKAKL